MKVVLFCGGFGMRMREYSDQVPKPMVPIGNRPVLWHLMRYYAHYGHKQFILCLGYRGDVIKEYFLDYKEWLSNDFVLRDGGRRIDLLATDIDDWEITFVDTGIQANIGERLRAVRPHVEDAPAFLANYADGLSDVPLPALIDHFHERDRVAAFLCARPRQSFHLVSVDEDASVRGIEEVSAADLWINAGFFVFKRELFDYIEEGEDLVREPFERLMKTDQLSGYRYEGFWAGMDTFKDRESLNDLHIRGQARWEVWRRDRGAPC